MKQRTLLLALIALLVLTGVAVAMDSAHYRLDWFTPLTGAGGGGASSAHYAVNLTLGQSAIGASSSRSYGGCLGYWCETAVAVAEGHEIHLPLLLRNYQVS
ncbi:MAG: hypothetical protein AMJ93_16080 [Anaerolineae bacterium SM23_84]|nr:MAG: hypothetical protein AMJ93_16080 [Anaerolineae bacterium SM23_84]